MYHASILYLVCLLFQGMTFNCGKPERSAGPGESSRIDTSQQDEGHGSSLPDTAIPGGNRTAVSTASRPFDEYGFHGKPRSVLNLPSSLGEISGIAFSNDGRLFAHDDEQGTVYQLDPASGSVIKRFKIGDHVLRKDLEDIAIVGDTMYLISSNGELFSFREGGAGEHVRFMKYTTGLTTKNNVEGLCYDPDTGCLLLACKSSPGKGLTGRRAVYSFELKTGKLQPAPRFTIDLRELRDRYGLMEFMPSGIARHPGSGNFFIISAIGNSILELSPAGEVLSYAGLPKKYHEQPEGIAFDGRGSLFIANEHPYRGKLVVY